MAKSAVVRAVALALLGSPVAAAKSAERWPMSGDVRECVTTRLDRFMDTFSSSLNCPHECADCFNDPMECLSSCANKEAACACSLAVPQVVGSLGDCCSELWDIFEGACRSAIEALGETVVNTISEICSSSDEDLAAEFKKTPGSLLVKTWTAVEQGAAGVISGLQAAGKTHPGAHALFELRAKPALALAEERSDEEYVRGHRMGGACLSLMEDIESEHAAGSAASEVPDLLAVSGKIAERAASMLGREMPSLKAEVHKAMTVAWSEEGPGMDSRDVCEVVLRHHDGL
uniref:Uncharacterized protein n=1 Tax=Alexandrium monilatum TaxID=311494 RepID=A0A7S4RM56_9DINO